MANVCSFDFLFINYSNAKKPVGFRVFKQFLNSSSNIPSHYNEVRISKKMVKVNAVIYRNDT